MQPLINAWRVLGSSQTACFVLHLNASYAMLTLVYTEASVSPAAC